MLKFILLIVFVLVIGIISVLSIYSIKIGQKKIADKEIRIADVTFLEVNH